MVRFRTSRYTLRGWSYCGQYAEAPCLCAAAKRRRRSRSSLPFKPLGSFVRVPREPADGNGVERSCRRSSQRPLRGPESRPLQLLRFCEFPLPVQVSLFVLTLVLQFAAHRFVVRCCPLCGCPPFQVLCPGPVPMCRVAKEMPKKERQLPSLPSRAPHRTRRRSRRSRRSRRPRCALQTGRSQRAGRRMRSLKM